MKGEQGCNDTVVTRFQRKIELFFLEKGAEK